MHGARQVPLRSIVATLILWLLGPGAARGQSGGTPPTGDALCRPADLLSARMVEELRLILSSTDSAELALRREVGIIYQPTGIVEFVSDEPVCRFAIQALNARTRTPGRRRQVYVYNLGSQYAVEDPEQRAGEFRMLRIFNQQWQLRGDIMWE